MASQAAKYRAARITKGLTQVELAQNTGLHPSTISFVERGMRVSPETAAKLEAALGLPTKERKP
jgi:transcriptional regulator with XRE-family HTH domain